MPWHGGPREGKQALPGAQVVRQVREEGAGPWSRQEVSAGLPGSGPVRAARDRQSEVGSQAHDPQGYGIADGEQHTWSWAELK